MGIIEILSVVIVALLALFGIEKAKHNKTKASLKEVEIVAAKQAIKNLDNIIQGLDNEKKAFTNPDEHDFTK